MAQTWVQSWAQIAAQIEVPIWAQKPSPKLGPIWADYGPSWAQIGHRIGPTGGPNLSPSSSPTLGPNRAQMWAQIELKKKSRGYGRDWLGSISPSRAQGAGPKLKANRRRVFPRRPGPAWAGQGRPRPAMAGQGRPGPASNKGEALQRAVAQREVIIFMVFKEGI